MLSMIRWLVLRFAALRWLFKLGGLGILIPIALLLKTIGLPILAVLSVIGLPILILLFLFGLPVILVLLFGSMLMGLIGFVLSIGVVVLKFVLLVGVPLWLAWVVMKKVGGWGRDRGDGWCGDDGKPSGGTEDPSPPPPPNPATPPATGSNPA